jgi:pimeloyl-ACP methyl ester carboxylesterase
MARILFLIALVLASPNVARAQPAQGDFFDSNGVRIHYVDSGRGDPVVLIHGFTGTYDRHWHAPGVTQALESAGYRAIGIDCRGHGESGKPPEPAQYGFEMVRDVVRLLDRLQIDRAHIVGYSMGGWIANQLLVKYPNRVRTVTVVGAGWEGEDVTTMTAQLEAMGDAFERRDASVLIRGVTAGQVQPSDQEIAALNAALFARNDPAALAAAARGMPALLEIKSAELRAAKVPVKAIVGEFDAPNRGSVERMRRVVNGLDVTVIPGATHATTPKPSAEFIVAFLKKHKAD